MPISADARPTVPTPIAVLLCAAIGAGLEYGFTSGTGAREAWDLPQYWTVMLPSLAAASAVFGWLSPRHGWAMGLAAVAGQTGVMWARNPGGSLWVVGLGFAALVAAGCALVGAIAAGVRRRRRQPA